MTQYEKLIVDFLSQNPDTFFSRKEISRRAVDRVIYETDPHWAVSALASLVARGILEVNDQGCYRLKKDAIIY